MLPTVQQRVGMDGVCYKTEAASELMQSHRNSRLEMENLIFHPV